MVDESWRARMMPNALGLPLLGTAEAERLYRQDPNSICTTADSLCHKLGLTEAELMAELQSGRLNGMRGTRDPFSLHSAVFPFGAVSDWMNHPELPTHIREAIERALGRR